MNPHTAYLMGIVGSDTGDVLSGMIDNGPLAIAFGTALAPSGLSRCASQAKPPAAIAKRKES